MDINPYLEKARRADELEKMMQIDKDKLLAYLEALQGSIARVRQLEALLAEVGAEEITPGKWLWPFYCTDKPPVMLETGHWIQARKDAAQGLFNVDAALCDNTSSEVLPDLDGQNLSD